MSLAAMARALVALVLMCGPFLSNAASDDSLRVTGGWVRAVPPGASVGAGYLRLHNVGKTTQRLYGFSTPSALSVELHWMQMQNGIMSMRQIDGEVALKPGQALDLVPGGMHLMLIGLQVPLREGGTVDLALQRVGLPDLRLTLPVLSGPPGE